MSTNISGYDTEKILAEIEDLYNKDLISSDTWIYARYAIKKTIPIKAKKKDIGDSGNGWNTGYNFIIYVCPCCGNNVSPVDTVCLKCYQRLEPTKKLVNKLVEEDI